MSEAFKEKSFEELYAELCALPNNLVGEIFNGELIASPRPSFKHARASSILGALISGPYDLGNGGPGGWCILDEPQLDLPKKVLVPDIAGWKKDRLPNPSELKVFEISPDWVCEILSPSTARNDRVAKFKIYADHKVPHYWIVDPLNKTLEIFQLEGSHYTPILGFGGDEKVTAPPFEDFEFNLGNLWAD